MNPGRTERSGPLLPQRFLPCQKLKFGRVPAPKNGPWHTEKTQRTRIRGNTLENLHRQHLGNLNHLPIKFGSMKRKKGTGGRKRPRDWLKGPKG